MTRLIPFLYIGFGGMLGSMLRFGISILFKPGLTWLGTGLINIFGSFLIGIVLAWTEKNQGNGQYWTWLLATGFCGGFTTFSTFSWENLQFIQTGRWGLFVCYTLGTLLLSFIAVWAGYRILQTG
jgi:CrcB protein